MTVLDPEPLKPGWTGKANAVWTAARKARGEWLLFTDADTIHAPGNLQRAIHEAQHAQVVMLSYSPRQLVTGFWQRALMPLIFSELALTFPPEKVSDPSSRVAAANGQFLMVQRAAYFQVGGHQRGGRLPAGGRRPGVPAQAQKISYPLPLRARRAEYPHVPQLWRHDGGLDQESGQAIRLSPDDGGLEGARSAPDLGLPLLLWHFFAHAGCPLRLGGWSG